MLRQTLVTLMSQEKITNLKKKSINIYENNTKIDVIIKI